MGSKMDWSTSYVLLYSLTAVVLYFVGSAAITYVSNSSKARRLGARPAPAYPQPVWDLLGIRALRRIQKADQEKVVPMHILERNAQMKELHGRDVHTYTLNVAGKTIIITSDPVNIQAMLAKQFHDFSLGSNRRGNFFPLLGNGIFTSDGKGWEHSRAMLRPSFARDQISDLDLEERHAKNLMRALPVAEDGWTSETDLQILFFRLTIDSSTEFLFGESVNSQINELPENLAAQASSSNKARDEKNFAHAFDTAQLYLSKRGRLGPRYWLINNAEFRKTCRQCHDFIDSYVRIALNPEVKAHELEKGSIKDKEKYVFLEELARQTQDPIELRSQLLHILLAGRDTTASLLGWTFYLLARHPDVYVKLRQTIIETFGTFESSTSNITFAALKNCQYLQYVLNETLRLFPVVPLNGRASTKDTTLPRGGGPDGQSPVFVPKDTDVGYSVYVMHRSANFWGEDCEEYKPERWSGRRPGWEYLPFNGGPRICLGQQFALTSAGYAVVRLLQRFDEIQNLDPTPMRQNATLTACSNAGVRVRLHEAK
ncbi:hypothetical protein FH972_026224 [Carpinus fangiana]|uniref:Cytochrome P450 n=1 Tax=Carpinus fangiana TaxID=176857 RepID=A0A5N6L3I7_9ROSI|nr:hypothetical protein FH972_026224 [Carpinus fangiana]